MIYFQIVMELLEAMIRDYFRSINFDTLTNQSGEII
jgi:hypothetical protein